MNDLDCLSRNVLAIADAVRARSCTAQGLLKAQLEIIDQREPRYGAYIVQTRARANVSAKNVDAAVAAEKNPGRLAGVPIAVKDIFDMAGFATTAGMAIRAESIAARDATVVQKLDRAGAVLLGKLTLTEGVYAEHRPPFAAPINPWNADYWSGASSTGSGVAVASGLCRAALGSETGGSIKLPAAANGVTALKPTWGRVSRHGVFELAATLDHIGPFARSVIDAAALLEAIAGPDENDPTAANIPVPDYASELRDDISGVRIGIDPAWIAREVDRETASALDDAVDVLRDCGATIETVEVPDVADMIWDWFPICAVQTALAHRDTFPAQREHYGPALAQCIDLGIGLSGIEYQKLILKRNEFRGRLEQLFSRIDMLALPVLSFPAPTIDRMTNIDDDLIAGLHRFTCPFNLSGSPGLVMPCGKNKEAMPIVFQLVGRHFDESRLLAAGSAFQTATDWHTRSPQFD